MHTSCYVANEAETNKSVSDHMIYKEHVILPHVHSQLVGIMATDSIDLKLVRITRQSKF